MERENHQHASDPPHRKDDPIHRTELTPCTVQNHGEEEIKPARPIAPEFERKWGGHLMATARELAYHQRAEMPVVQKKNKSMISAALSASELRDSRLKFDSWVDVQRAVALSASELRYRRLFEAAHDGILIVDPETRQIIDVNPFLVEFLGYAYDDFIGKELFEIGLLKDEAASQAAFRELRTTGFIRYENLPLETKDGRRVEVEFVSNLYQEGDQQVIQCNVRDISARKKEEEALNAVKEKRFRHTAELESIVGLRTAELRLSNAQLETFVYSIAHDLRAPLRTMQGFSQLLVTEHGTNLSEEGRNYANFINTAAQTMDRLLADLLVFSQISQEKIELAPVALETVVQSVIAGCETEIRESQARIESIPPWPAVLAHAATLRQVLVNLLGNAVKFVGSKTPHVRLRSDERPDGIVRIWVEDNGIGIPAEFQERIFQVFQRLHTTEYPGTGIGLAIVQKGVERMGGRIGVESAPRTGSKFWIELSKAPAAAIKL